MTHHAWISSFVWILTVAQACSGSASQSDRVGRDTLTSAPAPGTDSEPGPVPQPDGAREALLSAVASDGFTFDAVLSQSPNLYAVAVRCPRDHARVLLIYSRTSSGFARLGQFEMGADGLYPTVSFFGTTPSVTDAVLLAFDHAAEGLVGSQAFLVRGQQMAQTFRDSANVCRPAELKDVDRDGTLELIRYGSSLDPSDCEGTCSVMLREDVGVEPAWAAVLAWDGRYWSPAGLSVSSTFYADLAQRYRAAESFIDSTSAPSCRTKAEIFKAALARWADSASALVRRGGR